MAMGGRISHLAEDMAADHIQEGSLAVDTLPVGDSPGLATLGVHSLAVHIAAVHRTACQQGSQNMPPFC